MIRSRFADKETRRQGDKDAGPPPCLLVSLSPCLLVLLAAGCPGKPVSLPPPSPPKGGEGSIGVVVLVDTSGSMKESVPDKDGRARPKNQLAGEALADVLRQAGDWPAK